MGLLIMAILGLRSVTSAPIEEVRLIGSGYDTTTSMTSKTNWGFSISLNNFDVGDQNSKEGIVSVDLNLYDGCLNEAYLSNVVSSSLPSNTRGYLSVKILVDGREVTPLIKRTIDGRQDSYTQRFNETINQICGNTMTMNIQTRLETEGNHPHQLALVNQYLDIRRIGSTYSAALKDNPDVLVAILTLINILQYL